MGNFSPGPTKAVLGTLGKNAAQWFGPNGERAASISFLRSGLPVGEANAEVIWPGTGDFSYLAAAQAVEIISALADDGKQVEVQYLGPDFALRPPIILTLSNATPPTIPSFYRFLRMRVVDDLGVPITAPVSIEFSGTVYGLVATGRSVSKIATWSVPAGFVAAVIFCFYNIPAGKEATVEIQKREIGQGFTSWEEQDDLMDMIPGRGLVPYTLSALEGWAAIKIDEKSDFRVIAWAGGPNQNVTGRFLVVNRPIKLV